MTAATLERAPRAATLAYWSAISHAPSDLDVAATSNQMVAAVRRAAENSDDVGIFGEAANGWIIARFGKIDQVLRKACLAAAALHLNRRTPDLSQHLKVRRAEGHQRLGAYLKDAENHDAGAFTRDIAFVCGLAIPAGAMTVFFPQPTNLASAQLRSRRLVGFVARQAAQHNLASAFDAWRHTRLRGWAELHLDHRYVAEFTDAGLRKSFRAAAEWMQIRPDIGGLRSVSWLFDPALTTLSPHLNFMREIALQGGARLLGLPTNPDQTAYALQSSATRRLAHQKGDYSPRCYGLYWRRADLGVWSNLTEQTRLRAA